MSMLFKRIKDWATSITAFRTGDVIPVDGPSGTAKMSKDDLMREIAQNSLAGNIAPVFDPNKVGGYFVDEKVIYQGKLYRFKVNHSGAWASADVEEVPISEILNYVEGLIGEGYTAQFESGYFYQGSTTTIGESITFTKGYQAGIWECASFFLKKGFSIDIDAYGGNSYRTYYIVSTDGELLEVAGASAEYFYEYTATEDCFVYVNNIINYLPERYFKILGSYSVLKELKDTLYKDSKVTSFESGYYYAGSTTIIGQPVSFTKASQTGVWECLKIKIPANTYIKFKSCGGIATQRAFYIVSLGGILLDVADDIGVYEKEMRVSEDCYVYLNNAIGRITDQHLSQFSVYSLIFLLNSEVGLELHGEVSLDFEPGFYYQGSTTTVGSSITFTKSRQNGVWSGRKFYLPKGASAKIKVYGGNLYRGFYIVSLDGKLLDVAGGIGLYDFTFVASEDSFVYVNNSTGDLASPTVKLVGALPSFYDALYKDVKVTSFESGYFYQGSTTTIGESITFTKGYQAGIWECWKAFCPKGTHFNLKAYGGNSYRTYYIVSTDGKLLEVAGTTGVYTLDRVAEQDCFVYVNNIIGRIDDYFFETLSVSGSLRKLISTSGETTSYKLVSPTKIYTVCNDIGIDNDTADVSDSRQYSAAVSLDNMLYDIGDKPSLSIDENGTHRVVFDSILNATSVSGYNPQINNDTLWQASDLYEKNISFKVGEDSVTIKHVSVRSSKTSDKHVRLLCIGDSVTARSYGNINKPYPNAPETYWEWVKCLFELDRLQNGGTGYDCVMLGNLLRSSTFADKTKVTFDIDFGTGYQENDVVACACGWGGGTTGTWMGSGSPFYDSTTQKFSLQHWVESYRTLVVNNDGSVTRCNSSNKGPLAPADTTSYNVCEPTHVLIQLGYNQAYNADGETRTNYLNDLSEMIETIKTEYSDIIVMLSLPDNGGTYFPEEYPQYTGDIGMPNPYDILMYKGECKNWHDKFAFMNKDLMTLENTANGIYYVPTYFTSIGPEQVPFRVSNNAAALSLKDSQLEHRSIIGWSPHQHPNNAGHAAIGYEIYSLVKYTLLDQE